MLRQRPKWGGGGGGGERRRGWRCMISELSCVYTELVFALKAPRDTPNEIWLKYDFEFIGRGLITIRAMNDACSPFPQQPENEFTCALCFITLCKKVVVWDKRSPWASAGWVTGKALADTSIPLTPYSVFTMWLMAKDSKSQHDVKYLMWYILNFTWPWSKCKLGKAAVKTSSTKSIWRHVILEVSLGS